MAITKKGYNSTFKFVGTITLNEDSFKIDKVSNSGWRYNSFNAGIKCGEFGTHFAQAMGGYSTVKDNYVYVGVKTEDGCENRKVDWEDRFDDELVESAISPYRASIEQTQAGKNFTKNFVSAYDFIAYVNEHLCDGDVVSVGGDIEYQTYEGRTTTRYNVKSITKINSDDYKPRANFVQTLLLTDDCIGETDENGLTDIHGYAIEYSKEARGNVPFPVTYKFEFSEDKAKAKGQKKLMFSPKSGTVNAITFEGTFVSQIPTVKATADDIPEDIKALIELGLYEEDDIIGKIDYATNGKAKRVAVITKPRVYVDKNGKTNVQIVEDYCTEDDLDVKPVEVVEAHPTSEPMPTDDEDDFDLDSLFN
mgnify:CR=1 FL=1